MFEKILEEKNKIMIAFLLIAVGILGRLFLFKMLPNTPEIYLTINGVTQHMFMLDLFFVIAVISILSGLLLGGYYTLMVPLTAMIISDLIIGNTYILLFTWSGFALLGLIGYILKSKNCLTMKKIPTILGASIGGILLYDLWTNFGCWLGWYPKTLSGLGLCYTSALPFTLWHLLSTTLALTIVIIPIIYLKEHKKLQINIQTKPIEKPALIAVPAILMILAILSIIV